MKLKFLWNGIKVDGKLHRVWYSDGELIGRAYPPGTLTIYGRDYTHMPAIDGLTVQNDSDSQTDYFENDRIRVTPDNQHFPAITAAMQQAKEHNAKRYAARATIIEARRQRLLNAA
ncbi:MAG TPA: hypothetical protein ACFYD4_08390 [Candidatus Wunengus sp. YC61]|uniref:hypothetical protein n=1 Tax=Candidatus Wunengus sp. YC61 TaxID=3367698 RepID=UPI004029197C